jgi:trigger factor
LQPHLMKTEFVDVSETRKNLVVEIESSTVDAEIDRVARDYTKAARIPGFRPGKVPARVVKQRFRSQILHDVVHELVPRAVDDALRERGLEPLDTPDIRDVVVEEGQPLKFTATFDTVPSFDLQPYVSLQLRRPQATLQEGAVDETLQSLRERAARFEVVEARPVERGDTVVVDLVREAGTEPPDTHQDVTIEIGAAANPPGFDDEVIGTTVGETKRFEVRYPDDYEMKELAGTAVNYTVTMKGLKRRVVPDLDDEFARDLGEFDTLAALRARVEQDLTREAEQKAERDARGDLLKQLAGWVTFTVPESLIERELDRRIEDFARRLMEQGVDPRKADIDWAAFRQAQQEPARDSVASALVLDEVAQREGLTVSEAEIEAELSRFGERTGRTTAAVRAQLEKDGGISRLATGLRREKAVDFLRSRATIVGN